jgi:SP family galactose:H+ symporter-like MFS transporter
VHRSPATAQTSSRLPLWGVAAALGGFLFGYEVAVISGALLFIRQDLGLGTFEQGALVSMLPLGAMAGGLAAGRLADTLGRRRTLLLDAAVFAAGTVLAVTAPGFAVLLVARWITGFAVGVASSTVPLYLSEIAPPEARGRLVTMNQLLLTTGVVVAYLVDFALSGSGSWRWMFGLALVPAALLALGMSRAPESPTWLERRSAEEPRPRLGLRGLAGSGARPALIIGVTLAAAQQLAGINAVLAYAPSIMEKTGLSASNSILYSVALGVVNVAATVVSFRLVDRAGRRPLLLASLAGMTVSLVLLGITFVAPQGAATSWLSLICLLAYVASFAVGAGPIFWLLVAEIFPARARAQGASLSTAVNWFSGFVVGLGFLTVADALGEEGAFWTFAAVSAATFVFTRRRVPETKGRSFGEIEAELRRRWPSRRGGWSASRGSYSR